MATSVRVGFSVGDIVGVYVGGGTGNSVGSSSEDFVSGQHEGWS